MCDESAPKTPEEFLADLDLSGDALNAVALVFAAAEVKVRELHRDFAKVLGPIPFEDVERAAAVVTSCALELLDTAVGACLSKRMPPAIFDDKFTDLAARTERVAESWWLGIIDTFVIHLPLRQAIKDVLPSRKRRSAPCDEKRQYCRDWSAKG